MKEKKKISDEEKLKKLHRNIANSDMATDSLIMITLLIGILKQIWLPFFIGMPVILLFRVFAVSLSHYKKVDFVCRECKKTFRPAFAKFLFCRHSGDKRKLTCPECGKTSECAEKYHE